MAASKSINATKKCNRPKNENNAPRGVEKLLFISLICLIRRNEKITYIATKNRTTKSVTVITPAAGIKFSKLGVVFMIFHPCDQVRQNVPYF